MNHLQEIDEFRCVFCRQLFNPPYNLPYLLTCTHSLCTHCLNQAHSSNQSSVICPQDLQSSILTDLRSNCSARRALERLVKQHKSFSQNNQLLCIQSLSKHFQLALEAKSKQKSQFKELLDRIIENEIKRLRTVHKKVLEEMESPFRMVKEWKQMVREYLSIVKTMDRTRRAQQIFSELNYYIEEGRRIKSDLSQFQSLNFSQIANIIAVNPNICLRNQFSLQKYIQAQGKNNKSSVSQAIIQENKYEQFKSEERFQRPIRKHSKDMKKQKQNHYPKKIPLKCVTLSKEPLSNHEFATVNLRKSSQNNQKHEEPNELNQLGTDRLAVSQKQSQPIKQAEDHDINCQSRNFSCDQKLFVYSIDQEISALRQDFDTDQILLTEKEDKKCSIYPSKLNFLQEWQISKSFPSENIAVQKRQSYNWEKEKNTYIRKMQQLKVEQAKYKTNYQNDCLQLINYSISDLDLSLYLQEWDWQQLQVIKFVKAGLTDQQLNELLNFTIQSKVSTLVLSGNSLGQITLDALLNYTRLNSNLKNVYLSKNNINTLKGHTRQKISLLREQGINLYI